MQFWPLLEPLQYFMDEFEKVKSKTTSFESKDLSFKPKQQMRSIKLPKINKNFLKKAIKNG